MENCHMKSLLPQELWSKFNSRAVLDKRETVLIGKYTQRFT